MYQAMENSDAQTPTPSTSYYNYIFVQKLDL